MLTGDERERMAQRARERKRRRSENTKRHWAAKREQQRKRSRLCRRPKAARCECCGAYVGDTGQRHHLVPVARGGSNKPWNLMTLCAPCHTAAHQLWGKGTIYTGPACKHETRRILIDYRLPFRGPDHAV